MSQTVVKLQDTDSRIIDSVLWTEENGQEVLDSVADLELNGVVSVNNRAVDVGTNNVTVDAIHVFATNEGVNSNVQAALDATNDRIDTIGAGSVSSVNGQPPNVNGNVSVTDVFTFLGKASAFVAGTTFQGTFVQRSPSGGTQPNMYYNATDISYICNALEISCCRIIHDFQGGTAMYEGREDGGTFIYRISDKTMLNDKDIAYDDTVHSASLLQDQIKDIIDKGQLGVGTDKPFEVSFRCTTGSHPNLDADIDALMLSKIGKVTTGLAYVFRIKCTTNVGVTSETTDVTNKCYLDFIDGTNYEFIFDYDDFANVKVIQTTLKQEWSLDELGLDGTWSITDVPGNIKKAYDKVVSLIGNKTTFTIRQGLYNDSTAVHYEFTKALDDSIIASYGQPIGDGTFEFSITFGEFSGATNANANTTNFIKIKSKISEFTRQFDFDGWSNSYWLDEKGAPHVDLWADLRYFSNQTDGWSIDCPYRDYISGMTFRISDYDDVSGKYTNADVEIRYVPRLTTVSKPPNLSSGMADLIFDSNHSMLGSLQSAVNPIAITQIAQSYFTFSYGNDTTPHPSGIVGQGLLTSFNNDRILSAVVIHYGRKNWSIPENKLKFATVSNWEPPALLTIETPNIEPEIEQPDRF